MNTEELGGERRGCREGEKQQSEVNVVVGGGWVVVCGQTLRQVVAQLELELLRPCQFVFTAGWYEVLGDDP